MTETLREYLERNSGAIAVSRQFEDDNPPFSGAVEIVKKRLIEHFLLDYRRVKNPIDVGRIVRNYFSEKHFESCSLFELIPPNLSADLVDEIKQIHASLQSNDLAVGTQNFFYLNSHGKPFAVRIHHIPNMSLMSLVSVIKPYDY